MRKEQAKQMNGFCKKCNTGLKWVNIFENVISDTTKLEINANAPFFMDTQKILFDHEIPWYIFFQGAAMTIISMPFPCESLLKV